MGGPGRRPDRLTELSRAAGLPASRQTPKIGLFRPSFPEPTVEETTRVQEALTKVRTDQYETKKTLKIVQKNPSDIPFDARTINSKESTSVLRDLFESSCSAGEALMLIRMGAGVNIARRRSTSILKKVFGRDQEDIRSDIFKRAIEDGDVDLVNVLADNADPENINEGLKIALRRHDLEILKILMSVGANPNTCQEEFIEAVERDDFVLVSILSSGAVGLTEDVATRGLQALVRSGVLQSGHSSILDILLWQGANIDIQSPSALKLATKSRNLAVVAALCCANRNLPSPAHLAKCVEIAYADLLSPATQTRELIELLLAAGAEGSEIGVALVDATKRNEHPLVELLVDYAKFDTKTTPAALRAAIVGADLVLLRLLLKLVDRLPLLEHLSPLEHLLQFLQTAEVRAKVSLKTRSVITSRIVRPSMSKEVLAEALYNASANGELDVARVLLIAGASADYQSGRTLTSAVKLQSPELLSMLLETKGVSSVALNAAMKSLDDVPLTLKLKMTLALLKAGVKGKEVDRALAKAITQCDKSSSSYILIQALIRAGGNVSFGAGSCLLSAIEAADARAVKLILQIPQAKTINLDTAFLASIGVQDLNARYEIMQELLSAGAKGPPITKALIDVLEKIPREKRFSRLLVREGNPDINLLEGRAVSQATQHRDVELLHMLVKQQPSTTTLNYAIPVAIASDEGQTRFEICQILLQAGAKGSQVDDALIRAVVSIPCDIDLVRLFLKFGASIDHKSGSALQISLEKSDQELLKLLLQQPAQLNTVVRALGHALTLKNKDQRLQAVDLLTNANTKVPVETLGNLLTETLGNGDDLRLFQLLLSRGACVDVGSLEVFQKAISMNNASILQALLDANPAESTVRQAFEYAWKAKEKHGLELLAVITQSASHRKSVSIGRYLTSAVEMKPNSISLIQFLLTLEKPVTYIDNQCIQTAVKRVNVDTLGLLLGKLEPAQATSTVFRAAMQHPELWSNPEGINCAKLLLAHFHHKDVLNEFLLFATTNINVLANAFLMMSMLVAAGADSDYRNGVVLETAVQTGSLSLVVHLLDTNPSQSTIGNAFPYILRDPVDHGKVMALITAIVSKSKHTLDLNKKHKELDPVLFMCLAREDRKLEIMQTLLQTGASANQQIEIPLSKDGTKETISILLNIARTVSTEEGAALTNLLVGHGGK